MVRRLRRGDTHTVSTEVACAPERVWALVGDPTRYPELSPETYKVAWRGGATEAAVGARFRGWNRKRVVWPTTCRIDALEPGRALTFTTMTGGGLTRWTWRVEPGATGETSVLSETVEMAKDMPLPLVGFELFGMGDSDRLAALRDNLASSVERVKQLAEAA